MIPSASEWLLFLPGFLLGLLVAPALASAGISMRIGGDTLAALSYAQVATAGAMLGTLLGWAPGLGAWALALSAGLLMMPWRTNAARTRGGTTHALLLLLLAWACALLLADNHPDARLLGTASIEGQLLLIRLPDVVSVGALCILGLLITIATHRAWTREQLLTWQRPGRQSRQKIIALGRETGLITLIAAGTLSVGVFATLALTLIPAYLVWSRCHGLRSALHWCALLGVVAHVLAFVLSLLLDQVYAAVVVVVLGFLLAGVQGVRFRT